MKEAAIEFELNDWVGRDCPEYKWGEQEEDYFSFIGRLGDKIVTNGAYRRMGRPGTASDNWAREVTVSVHSKHQGRGLGRATLQFMMDHMREQGINHALARNYWRDDPGGGELLKSCGFKFKKTDFDGTLFDLYECNLSQIGNF